MFIVRKSYQFYKYNSSNNINKTFVSNQILTLTFFKKQCIYLYSVCIARFIPGIFCTTKQDWGEIWRLIHKAMTRKGLRPQSVEVSFPM